MAYIMIRLMKWLSYLVDISKRKKENRGNVNICYYIFENYLHFNILLI